MINKHLSSKSYSLFLYFLMLSMVLHNTVSFNVIPSLVLKNKEGSNVYTECERYAIQSKFQKALSTCQNEPQDNLNAKVLVAYSRYMLGEKQVAFRILYGVFLKAPLNLYLIVTYAEIFSQQNYKIEPRQLFNFAVQREPNSLLAIELNKEFKFDINNDEEQILIESSKLDKEDPQYLSKVCKMNFELKNHILTMETCLKAYAKNQNDFEISFAISVTAFRLENAENFEKFVLQAAKLNKKDPAALNNLGIHYYLKDNNDFAISAFKQAIQQDQYFFRTYYNLAIAFIEQKNYKNAIASLKRYNSLFPYDSNGYYLLGYSYQKLNDLNNAIIQYDFALKVQPSNVNALYNKAQVLKLQNKEEESKLILRQAIQKLDREDFDIYYGGNVIKISLGYKGEYKCYSESFEFNKQLKNEYEYLSNLLYQNQKYGEALECYTQLLKQFENNNQYYYKRIGDIYLKTGKIDIAQQVYDDGLKKYSNDTQLLLGKAAVLQGQQKDQEAQQLYNKILELDNKNFKALNNLGYMYLTKQEYQNAIQKFQQALELQPEDTIVLLNLGKAEYAQNNLDKSRQYFEQVIDLDPLNAQAYYMLSQYYSTLEQPNYERSMQLVNRAIYLDNSIPDFYLHKANLFDRLGLSIEALPSYENLSRLTPTNVFVLMKLGAIYDSIDTPEQSAAIYEQVISLEPSNFSAFYLGGVALLRIGDYEASNQYLIRATQLKPDFVEAYIALGDLAAINKNYKLAKQYFEKAQSLSNTNEEIIEKLKKINEFINGGDSSK